MKPARQAAVHIVVTCANRKRAAVPDRLRIGSLGQSSKGRRFASWTRRLESSAEPSLPAREMYAGEHWMIARDLTQTIPSTATLWVCSAGYGLLNADTAIKPYAATFTYGTDDSVGDNASDLQNWWSRLTEWPGPAPHAPRSFADLAASDPHATVIAVLSDPYLRACAHDLIAAQAQLHDSQQLSVIGPAEASVAAATLVVPVTAALRPVVGGSLQALHVRVAAMLLAAAAKQGYPLTRSALQKVAAQATAQAPKDNSRRVEGTRLTDAELRAYIRRHVHVPRVSAAMLLRQLRESGHSCEQGRFKALFADEQFRAGR